MIERTGNQTGQMTFDKEVWDSGFSYVFEGVEDYVLITRCTGFSCDVTTAVKGKNIGNYVTK